MASRNDPYVKATPWHLASWEGNRSAQHRAFRALSFREKLQEIERMEEVAELFEARRIERGLPVRRGGGNEGHGQS